MQTQPASLAFPWPQPDVLRGPAVRTVVRDPVWMATLRRHVDRWRAVSQHTLPMVKFFTLSELKVGEQSDRLLDIVEVASSELSSVSDWIDRRRGKDPVAAVLCRQTLTAPEDLEAAGQLLREAGAAEVFASPHNTRRLTEMLGWLHNRAQTEADLLEELPLRCWAPPWQPAR